MKHKTTRPVTVSGWAYADAPLRDAALSISAPDGETLLRAQPGATNELGTFAMPAELPADYRVILEGGNLGDEVFTGRLVADVVDYGPSSGLIQVNPITTLLAAYRDRHRDLSPEEAQGAVRRFLRLPHGIDVTADLRGNEDRFSAAEFNAQAETAGGIQPFVDQLVGKMDAGPDATHAFAGAAPSDVTSDGVKAAAKALAKYGLKQLLEQVGLQPPDQKIMDTLSQISGQLNRLQASVDEIKTLVLQTDYDQTIAPAVRYKNQTATALAKLQYGVANDDQQSVDDAMGIADQLVSNTALEDLHAILVAGDVGKTSAAKLASDGLRSRGPFWTPAKSNQLLGVFDYFDSVQAQLVLLLAERSHARGKQTPENFEKTVVATYDQQRTAEQAMRPPAAPAPIDLRSNLMWPVNIDRPDNPWWSQLNEFRYFNVEAHLHGFADWRLPESNELKDLVAGQAHPKAWLRDPSNWGSTALVRHAPLVDVVNVWSGTHDSDPRAENHWGTNMDTGRQASWRDSGLAIVWPVRAVREKYWLS
jgi:hypothetical protein